MQNSKWNKNKKRLPRKQNNYRSYYCYLNRIYDSCFYEGVTSENIEITTFCMGEKGLTKTIRGDILC